ncbi:toxin-antitoxin system YwqK family antitoxin [Maribellus sediminis]|uniref:toxin-antitoxin system YwqK family antitoxin n=1 Tax=Maribellus sediminis TaxID=2696285 RepID=UPI0014315F32|nr:hypothetical protein [Maribellus sediminis]
MQYLGFFLFVLLFLSCNSNNQKSNETVFDAGEIVITFNRDARITTFITKEGEAVNGKVVQHLANGGLNTWKVENGLATLQIMYYPNGQVERTLELKNGVEHGSFVMYYPDGSKYVEQHYADGEPVGTWYRWNKNGELVETKEQ